MDRRRAWLVCLVSGLLVVACSGGPDAGSSGSSNEGNGNGKSGETNGNGQSSSPTDPTSGATTVSSHSEQVDGQCPSSPEKLRGAKSAGESCSTYADCKPSCCDCSSGSSFLSAACVDGVCAGEEVACGRSRRAFCGDGDTGGSNGGGNNGGSSSGGSSTSSPVCVDGTAASCYGSSMTWTGGKCCVDGPTTCTNGTGASCYGSKVRWTGALCCVSGAQVCVNGTGASCYGTGMTWTGAQCCVAGAPTCVPGTAASCYGTGKHWTGALCCVD